MSIKVLVVDDSALVREILVAGLAKEPDITVVAQAEDPYDARDKILEHRPDVMTLDIEMPRMDGITFLKKLMGQYPIPVVMVSSLTGVGQQKTFEALDAGAVDFVTKPTSKGAQGLSEVLGSLKAKIRVAAQSRVRVRQPSLNGSAPLPEMDVNASAKSLIAIGGSTGGSVAARQIISKIPKNAPPIIITIHMPAGFTAKFAEMLDQDSPLDVVEATNGLVLKPNMVCIAAGGFHLEVRHVNDQFVVRSYSGDKVNGHCPSVDVMFKSCAQHVGKACVGVMLSGMGSDGAEGLKLIQDSGGQTLAQDETTSVVFGMAKRAQEIGAVRHLFPIDKLAGQIIRKATQHV